MISPFEKKVSGNEWLWQEVPMSRSEGMIEHVALSNTSAVVVERYEQDEPFGKSHTLDASGNNLGNFASQVHHYKRMHGGVVEEVTGLYDFRNRWYSPESGSWLSRDPLGQVDSENLYQGFGGNSLLVTDRYGLSNDQFNTVTNKTGHDIEVFGDAGNGGQESFGIVPNGETYRGPEPKNDVDIVVMQNPDGCTTGGLGLVRELKGDFLLGLCDVLVADKLNLWDQYVQAIVNQQPTEDIYRRMMIRVKMIQDICPSKYTFFPRLGSPGGRWDPEWESPGRFE